MIGTGSSGIQVTPVLAQQTNHLYVFQRTPNFSIPAWNAPLSKPAQDAWKKNYAQHRVTAKATSPRSLFRWIMRSARKGSVSIPTIMRPSIDRTSRSWTSVPHPSSGSAHAINTRDHSFEVGKIVFATGYDAVTGSLAHIAIKGRDGEELKQKWLAGPKTYLGLMSTGYPNFFHHYRIRQSVGTNERGHGN